MIQTTDLQLTYGSGAVMVQALRDINLQVEAGELLAVTGPSGSGKSSLLHVLGAMLSPSSGQVLLDGKDITALNRHELSRIRREHIGFIFQNFSLIPNLTAIENVMTPLYPVNPTWLKERADSLLQQVGLEHRMLHRPEELSGGERQRVAIARALINHPNIIYGDEITGNLDTKAGDEIMGLIKELNGQGTTFVIVTHDQAIANQCHRQVRMRDGQLEEA